MLILKGRGVLIHLECASVYLHVFLTTRWRLLGGDLGPARRQEIPDLLLEITDPVRQSEIIGAQSAQRREGLALSKDHYLRSVGRNSQKTRQVASARSYHQFSVHFQDPGKNIDR